MPSFAECTEEQKRAEIELLVYKEPNGVKAGGKHGMMDRIIIKAPVTVSGIPIEAMELTRGEVSELWIPVAYELSDGVAVTAISGYPDAIKNFEIAVYYKNDNCKKSIQRML